MYKTPLVRLQAEGDWSADMDAMVVYSPLQPFSSSTWDWIGLYKVGLTTTVNPLTMHYIVAQVSRCYLCISGRIQQRFGLHHLHVGQR